MSSLFCGTDYDADRPSFYQTKKRKARKSHACCECKEAISVETEYILTVGVWGGDFSEYKTCKVCSEIQDKMGCFIYGQIFGDLTEEAWNMGDDLPLEFFDGLSIEAIDKIDRLVLSELRDDDE